MLTARLQIWFPTGWMVGWKDGRIYGSGRGADNRHVCQIGVTRVYEKRSLEPDAVRPWVSAYAWPAGNLRARVGEGLCESVKV